MDEDKLNYTVMSTSKLLQYIDSENFTRNLKRLCDKNVEQMFYDLINELERLKHISDGSKYWCRILTKIELIPKENGNPRIDFSE